MIPIEEKTSVARFFVSFCVLRIKLETLLIHSVAVLAANVCVCSFYYSSALKSYSSI